MSPNRNYVIPSEESQGTPDPDALVAVYPLGEANLRPLAFAVATILRQIPSDTITSAMLSETVRDLLNRTGILVADSLPDASDYPTGQTILVGRNLYKHYVTADANVFVGVIGEVSGGGFTLRGTRAGDGLYGAMGQWTSNPNHAISWLTADSYNHLEIAIERGAFRTAKGSNEADDDTVTLEVTVGETTQTVTATILDSASRTFETADGFTYLLFDGTAPADFVLTTADVGEPFELVIKRNSAIFIVHDVNVPHWNIYPLGVDSLATAETAGLMSGAQFNKLTRAVPSFDSLPDATDYPLSQVILVDGKFYINSDTTEDVISGIMGRIQDNAFITYGIHAGDGIFSAQGQWVSNPNRLVSWLLQDEKNDLNFAIRRDSYRAAKGSNEADNDTLTLELTAGETTETITVTYNTTTATASDGVVYLVFYGTAQSDSILRTTDVGDAFSFTIAQNGSAFIRHDGGVKHWNVYPLFADRQQLPPKLTVGGSFPSNPLRNDLHLFDAAATSLTGAVGTDGTTAKTTAQLLDLFRYDGTNWRYVGFIGDSTLMHDGVVTQIRLDTDDTLLVDRSVGAQLRLNLAQLRHIRLISVLLDTGNDLSTAGIDNHAETYGDADQYEFRSPILNTGAVRLRVRYTEGGQLRVLDYKPVLDIHGHALVAGAIQVNELIEVRYDTDIDAWISNVYPLATTTQPGLMSAYQFNKLGRAVASFDSLPNASNYEVGQVIAVDGRVYKNYATPAADAIAGVVGQVNFPGGDTLRGVHTGDGIFTALGQWTSNPNGVVSWVTVDSHNQISFAIKRSDYRAEKGSNEADGDQLTLSITNDGTTESTTVTIRPSNSRTVTTNYGEIYLVFVGTVSSNFILNTADFGSAFTVIVQRSGSNFLTHIEGLKHWNVYPLAADRQQLPPTVTVGANFPPNPYTNDLHIFDSAASSLVGAVGRDGTTAQSTARAFDLFRFNGRNWQLVGFIGDTDTVGDGGGGAGISIGGSFPSTPSTGAVHLFNAAASSITGAVSTDGTTTKTSAQALDLFQYDGTNWVFVGFIGTDLPVFDSLPDAADYDAGQVVVVDGRFYENAQTPAENVFAGILGQAVLGGGITVRGMQAPGFGFAAVGTWTSDPDSGLLTVIAEQKDSNISIEILILQSAYRAAKGSNEAPGDQLTIEITAGDVTESRTLDFDTVVRSISLLDGRTYLVFDATFSASVLWTAEVGTAITILIKQNGSDFITHAAELPHWIDYALASDRRVSPILTRGPSFPTDPRTGDMHLFDAYTTSLTKTVDTDGTTAKTTARAFDLFQFINRKWQYVGFIGTDLPVFDSLPDATAYDPGQVVAVDGRFYENAQTPAENVIAGTLGEVDIHGGGGTVTVRGLQSHKSGFPAIGEWTSNPNHVLVGLTAELDDDYDEDGDLYIVLMIDQGLYRTAKGSNEADTDMLTVSATIGGTTETITMSINTTIQRYHYDDGTTGLIFHGIVSSSLLWTAEVGTAITILLSQDGNDFITHAAGVKHWVDYALASDRKSISPALTHGISFPSAPRTADLHLFTAAVTSLTNTVDTDGTTAKTTAKALDLFRFAGNKWRYVGFIGDTTVQNAVTSTDVTGIVKRTQAQFDAIETPDANTFYAIVG